eukprot:1238621-Pleurochrysis_carterae.AAC.1
MHRQEACAVCTLRASVRSFNERLELSGAISSASSRQFRHQQTQLIQETRHSNAAPQDRPFGFE